MGSRPYVFFDMDDTLVQWQVSWTEAFSQVAREAGTETEPEEALEALNTAFSTFYGDYLQKHSERGDEAEFWLDYDGRILEMLGVTEEPRRAAARVTEILKRPGAIRLFPEVGEVLRTLAREGARLGTITGRPRAAPDLEALGVLHYFDPVVDGLSVGDSKRVGSALFARGVEAASAAGAVGWHVGDSYEGDVEPAREAGLRPILVDRAGAHPEADCIRVGDLAAIPGVVLPTDPSEELR